MYSAEIQSELKLFVTEDDVRQKITEHEFFIHGRGDTVQEALDHAKQLMDDQITKIKRASIKLP